MFIKSTLFTLAVTISVQFFPFSASADGVAKNLKTLIQEYLAMPSVRNELLTENMMNNPLLVPHLKGRYADIDNYLATAAMDARQKVILKKQYLMGEIFKEALIEVEGPESSHILRELIFDGKLPASLKITGDLPKIERLASLESLYEIIFLMLQREESVRVLALDILAAKGNHYPSSDSFARGLARYAAISAIDGQKFEQILNVFDQLYVLENNIGSRSYNIGSISGEVTTVDYNAAFGDPKLKPIIIKNLFEQLNRHPGPVHADLLKALALVPDNAEVHQLVADVLKSSTRADELGAVLSAIGLKSRREFDSLIYEQLPRLLTIKSDDGRSHVAEIAIQDLQAPYNNLPKVETLQSLIEHPHPGVRQRSIYAILTDVFPKETQKNLFKRLLKDEDASVRFEALGLFWSARFYGKLDDYQGLLQEISKSDPSEKIRKSAADAFTYMKEKELRNCEMLLRNHEDPD